MKVQDVMVHQVSVVGVDQTVNDALREMWTQDVGALPVLDAERRVVGMVTDRDLAMATWLWGRLPAQIPIREVMSRSLWTIAADQPLHRARELLRQHQIRRLPVCDAQGHLLGMVTLCDLARAEVKGVWKGAASQLARTFDAITRPRFLAHRRDAGTCG